ncbi:Gfo/Idh/MocA family protein [Devosia sp.]|uniref:Gfo/Idh/MocA family protein n=1 Tax=Devosia sp. TaxID=1871048 RepID=UPI003BAB53A2
MKRAVLVGCGVMGARWVTALCASPLQERVELVGLVDVDLALATSVRDANRLTGAIVGTALAEVLDATHPDMVFDVAVPAVRRQIVLTAFEHGCDVLTEKPMAGSMEDARDILAAARQHGRIHGVIQNRRFKQSIRRIRAFLQSGAIGEISALHCDFFVGAHFGGFRDAMEHVLLLDMAIHTLDAARFMSGKNAVAVYCQETNPKGSWYAHDAAANAIFELDDDVTFTYRGSWAAEGANTSWEAAWRIIGSKGTLLWDGEDTITASIVDGDEGFFRPLRSVEIPQWNDDRVTKEHVSAIEDFLDAVESRGTPECVGTDNIKSLEMVFSAIESARTRQRVHLQSGN